MLRIDCVKLLIDRLQLLCRGLQLFIGCKQFLIGCLQFPVYRFQPLDGGTQIVLGLLVLPFQIGDAAGRRSVQVVLLHDPLLSGCRVIQEKDRQQFIFVPVFLRD